MTKTAVATPDREPTREALLARLAWAIRTVINMRSTP
jgi:hypothetical protein